MGKNDSGLIHPSQRATPFFIKCVNVLMVALFALLCVVAFIRTVHAEPEDHWLCNVMDTASVSRAGRVAEWDAQGYGWVGMPTDLNQVPIDILFADEQMSAGYVLYFSASQQELWVFPQWSFNVSTDPNGQHEGTHDLCPVRIYDLNPEHR